LKTGEIGSGRLSKLASWLWLAFKLASWLCPAFKMASWLWLALKIGELALASFQNQRVGSGRLSKALGAALRNLLSNRSKGFELADLKKL
jgi:hypothetical protein